MISQAIRQETADHAVWLDETSGPLEPRNIYGVTKLAAEGLVRVQHQEAGLNAVILRTSRFFPEEDDTHRDLSGENMKANEFLNRRATVEDMCAAHIAALDQAPVLRFGTFVISAPPPFTREDAQALKADAPAVIARYYPQAAELYARKGWSLPRSLGRVYDPALAEHRMGFRAQTDFAAILNALQTDSPMPFAHDAAYVGPVAGTVS